MRTVLYRSRSISCKIRDRRKIFPSMGRSRSRRDKANRRSDGREIRASVSPWRYLYTGGKQAGRQADFLADDMPMSVYISWLHLGKHTNDSDIARTTSPTRPSVLSRSGSSACVTGRNRFINTSYAKRSTPPFVFSAIYICPNLSAFISRLSLSPFVSRVPC